MPDNDVDLRRLVAELGLESIEEAAKIRHAVERCRIRERRTGKRARRPDGLHVGRHVWLIVAGGKVVGGYWTTEAVQAADVRALRFYTTLQTVEV